MSGMFLNALAAFKSIGNFSVKTQTGNAEGKPQQNKTVIALQDDCFMSSHKQKTYSLWDLPESVLVCILRGLHIRDLLSFRMTHSYFCSVVDNNTSIWASVSFADAWPHENNNHLFVKAAEKRNLEAVVKLAVAYLYKEEITGDDVAVASKEAAHYLCQAEKLTPTTFPFFWIFIRPPWSPEGSCCKLKAFLHIKEMLETIDHPDITFGTALILKLQRMAMHGDFKAEEEKYFKRAIDNNSPAAAFFNLMDAIAVNEPDKGKELEKVRLLRQIASNDVLEAKLNLIRYYTQGLYGGISKEKAQEYVQQFFKSSKPSGIHVIFSGSQTSDISRYILIDWLVEVVGMKDFSAHVLYFAVSLFDRFLQVRRIQRSQVQLLGVAAIVLSSRFLGFEILTIREAAWLTDNSYTYYDVVRMMGELVATLRGNLRALTIQDYTKVLLTIINESGYAGVLTEYISMLCLLQAEMGQYSPAEIAASCLLLSRILLNYTDAWPKVLKEWTGFTQDYLSLCTFHIYNKCLMEGSEMEYRDTILQAVKTRYADPLRYSVSSMKLIGHKELCRRLGVTKMINHGKDAKAVKFRNTDELIMSPHRSLRSEYRHSVGEAWVDRDNAATPPISVPYIMDEGFSGYEGDLESESDESADKSEVMFENLDVSILAEDGKHWYSSIEDHLADDQSEDTESLLQDEVNSPGDKTSDFDTDNRIACLSSMCQSGANLACHSSTSFPSPCISNCSCKKSYGLAASTLSLSSPSLAYPSLDLSSLSSSLSSSLPALNHGNVRTCLPCGSISSAAKGSRKSQSDSCSNRCDILAHTKQVCDETPCPSHLAQSAAASSYIMRKARSSQDLRTSADTAASHDNDLVFDVSWQSHPQDIVGSAPEKLFYDLGPAESMSSQVIFLSTDGDCLEAEDNFSIESSSEYFSDGSQGSSCNNNNIYTSSYTQSEGSSDFHHIYCESSLLPDSLPCGLSADQGSHSLYLNHCVSSADSPQPGSSNGYILVHAEDLPEIEATFDNISGHKLLLRCVNVHGNLHIPATPESVMDMQKFSSRASTVVRNQESFTGSSFGETSSSRFTTKRARLEYSGSLSSSVDYALRQLDLGVDMNACDKAEESAGLPVKLLEDFCVNDNACDASSKVSLKRKSCK